ncbi:hypothetical protein N7478_009844 [Penicillium angulare]|uniref:uncharacterized protein n=1 Tax=Penicillium angulare TaxID=116970 RepID=UPI002541E6DF|nr:uncharacterized protein N7478_009844 [Penicillium angulare]KAJ5267036.1 hypothetical protein N7478_009844 [Penicillium angulare]
MSSQRTSPSKSGDMPKRDFKEALEPAVPHLARIPTLARFFLVVVTSLIGSSVLFTLTSSLTVGDLGLVSKHLEEWWEVAGLVVWRVVEVGLPWALGFDSWDVASFLYLTHLPTYSLLTFFYGVRPTSALVSYAITVFSIVIPFFFLRSPASVHDLSHAPSGAVANRAILQDRPTTIYTTLAATSIFTVVLYASYASWLPTQLVVHFESIPDISAAHAGPAGLPVLFLTLIPSGYAVRDFLFVSSTGHSTHGTGEDSLPVDHESQYVVVSIYCRTIGQLSAKTRILASRTFVLAASVLLNTIVQLAGTVQSISVQGAFLWGSVWAFATLAIGGLFSWVEAVPGV